MKKMFLPLAAAVSITMLASSCSKDPVDKLSSEESRLYITNRDSSVNFSTFKTFSISDSVAIISNNQLQEKTRDQFDTQLISAVASALTQRGFTQVAANANPDLGINVSNIINTYTGFVDYGNYYNSYYGYMDPFYWGYPGYGYYGSFIGTYQTSEGAIAIDVFDLKNASSSGRINAVWSGLIRGNGIFSPGNISTGVNALFDQSAYLRSTQ